MSDISDVCDDVKTLLDAGTFTPDFTAERAYQVRSELKSLNDLKVYVVPRSRKTDFETRSKRKHTYSIYVGVLKRFDSDANTIIDPLTSLMEQIDDYLATNRILSTTKAVHAGSLWEPLYDVDHMNQWRQFTGIITVEYLRHD